MSTTRTQAAPALLQGQTVYNRVFWMAFAANVSLMTANTLTFRFAELVAWLGGSEKLAGTIVSIGVLGALIARLVMGQAIDRHGVRKLWMISSLLFIAACGMFLGCRQISWVLYVARIAFAAALSGMFTCSIVHIQNQVPAHRRTEIIGSLGSSGFVGMVVGSQLGDWIFNTFPVDPTKFTALFGIAMVLGVFYLTIVTFLTRRQVHQRPHETPAAHRLLFRYWPGYVVLAALMMGVSFTVTTVFLTRFSTFLQARGDDVNGIGTFFTSYAASAFVFRLATRNWSHTVGRHRMILLGLAGHGLGHCLLPLVSADWHFLIPSIACGLGHALLFPAVISMGAGAFPRQYRGSGTTLVLGFMEVGAMLSAPLLGAVIDFFGAKFGLRIGFFAMFYTSASIALTIGVVYAFTAARNPDNDIEHDEKETADWSDSSQRRPACLTDDATTTHDESDEPLSLPMPHLGRIA